MFLELIAVFVAGFAGAGLMMLLSKLAAGRLPKWLIPIGAGAAMLTVGISNEYTWYNRISGNLPDGFVVATSQQSSALWRPWTYIAPITERFIAIDTNSMVENQQTPGLFLAHIYAYGRWRPVQSVQNLVDCTGHRRADPSSGDIDTPNWLSVGPDDPIVQTVCKEA